MAVPGASWHMVREFGHPHAARNVGKSVPFVVNRTASESDEMHIVALDAGERNQGYPRVVQVSSRLVNIEGRQRRLYEEGIC